jgi:hypothetical protein
MTIHVPLSDRDTGVLEDIRQAGAFRSCEDAIRGALWWYGRFLDVSIDVDVFAIGGPAPTGVESPDQPSLFASGPDA